MNRRSEKSSRGVKSKSSIPIIDKEPPPNLLPSKHEFPKLLFVLSVASLVAWSSNLLFTSLLHPSTKPFCDNNSLDNHFPDSCEPCPSNGECNDGKLECLRGYQKHGNLCVEDGDINESARKITETVERHLCGEYAQFLCSGTGSIWVHDDDLLNYFEPVENVKEGNALYNYTKQKAFDMMDKLLETRLTTRGMKEFKCPDSLVEQYKPYACRLRQWITQHILVVLPICAMVSLSKGTLKCTLHTPTDYTSVYVCMISMSKHINIGKIKQLVGCVILFWNVRRKLRVSRRVEELYNKVCEILEENALTSKSVNGECEPWVVASRLRDHLLLPRERKDPLLWKKVEELVQEDSRVDRYPKLVKGESKVVWEWQVEGSLSATKMLTKRDASKTTVNRSTELNSQQRPTMKAEPMEPHF